MNVLEVSVSASKKLGLPKYSSKEFFINLKANVSNQSVEAEVKALQVLAEKLIEEQETAFLKEHEKEVVRKRVV